MLLILIMGMTVIIQASGVGAVVVVARLLIEMLGLRKIDLRTRLYGSVQLRGLKICNDKRYARMYHECYSALQWILGYIVQS